MKIRLLPILFPAPLLLAPGALALGLEKAKSFDLPSGGLTRSYLLYAPPAPQGSPPRPLVLVLHGGGGNGRGMERLTYGEWNLLADKESFLVAYPEGVEKHWNDGRGEVDERAAREDIPDVVFISDLIDSLVSRGLADPARVFACGISNGGMMTFRLGCELAGKLAGLGVVASSMPLRWGEACSPAKPLSLLIMAGTDDPLVPYGGGFVKVFRKTRGKVLAVPESARIWAEADGCQGPRERDLEDKNPDDGMKVRLHSWEGGRNGTEVQLYEIQGGGHTWPGGKPYLPKFIVGKVLEDMDGTRILWDFFKRQGKRN